MNDRKEAPASSPSTGAESTCVSAVEERLHVGIAEQETAIVRVRKIVHTDRLDIPVLLRSRLVTIERVPANRFVESEFEPRHEGDTWIVPVFEYVPVTEMRLMLKEEIRIGLEEQVEASVHQAEVQREELVVERRTGTAGDWIAQPAAPPSKDGEQSAL